MDKCHIIFISFIAFHDSNAELEVTDNFIAESAQEENPFMMAGEDEVNILLLNIVILVIKMTKVKNVSELVFL